jgi:hypothetical protein
MFDLILILIAAVATALSWTCIADTVCLLEPRFRRRFNTRILHARPGRRPSDK